MARDIAAMGGASLMCFRRLERASRNIQRKQIFILPCTRPHRNVILHTNLIGESWEFTPRVLYLGWKASS